MGRRLVMWSGVVLNAAFAILTTRYELPIAWFTAMCTANIIFLFALNYAYNYILREICLLDGNRKHPKHFFNIVKNQVSDMREALKESHHIIASINVMGDTGFNSSVSTIKSEEMRVALSSANDKIQKLLKEEEDRNWIMQGVASITGLKQKNNEVTAYGDQVLAEVIKYLNANQGGFFVVRNDENDHYLELISSYAYGEKKSTQKRINPGEGLAGQMLYEKQVVYLTDIPTDYSKITSGLGEALPRSICIVPLLFDGVVYGVLEIASLQKFSALEIEYLKRISENVGYNLGAIESHRKTEILLEKSQKMAAEVRSQEEELRQNMEELQATHDHLKKKEYEMEAVLASLSTVELDNAGNIVDANDVFLAMSGFKINELVGTSYRSLISPSANDAMQYELMLNNILSGRTFSGEFRLISRAQKEIWMAGNFTPIMDAQGKPYKIMVISVFTTQDKEKLHELQQFVAALKSCLAIAEINQDVSFKTANDLFLAEVGMRRLDLRNASPKSVLTEESFKKVEKHILDSKAAPDNMMLAIQNSDGSSKSFNATLVSLGGQGNTQKKGLLILRNPV